MSFFYHSSLHSRVFNVGFNRKSQYLWLVNVDKMKFAGQYLKMGSLLTVSRVMCSVFDFTDF